MSNFPPLVPGLPLNNSDSDEVFLSSPCNDKKRIIILDWDDTFLPTSYLLSRPWILKTPYHQLSNDLKIQLQNLEMIVLDLILKIIKLDNCHCYIVSNAMSEWIFSSCQTYFPSLFTQVLRDSTNHDNRSQEQLVMYGENSSLICYSACELFARQCPNQRGLWKLFTFTYIVDSKLLIPENERRIHLSNINNNNNNNNCNNHSHSNLSTQTGQTANIANLRTNIGEQLSNGMNTYSSSIGISKSKTVRQENSPIGTEEEEQTSADNEDNLLPSLFEENEFEDEIDWFELGQGKESVLLQSMRMDKSEWDLISIGDAEYEATAALQVGCTVNANPQLYRHVTTKVVKMPRLACVPGMIEQLHLLRHSFSKLLACGHSIFVDHLEALSNGDGE